MPEANFSHAGYRGFYTVKEFIERDPMPGSGVLGIKAWRRAKLDGNEMKGTTPLQIADQLAKDAATVHQLLPGLRARPATDAELQATLNDLEMFASLGDYYAAKIRAACDLAMYDSTGSEQLRASAIQHLEAALAHWQTYAGKYAAQYQERVLYNRVGWVDRTAFTEYVKADIQLAREWKMGSMKSDQPAHPSNPRAD
jgi:hypothetical protein